MSKLTGVFVVLMYIAAAPVALAIMAWGWLMDGPEPIDCVHEYHPHHGACLRPYRERSAIDQYKHHVEVMEQGRRLQAYEERNG